MGDDAGDPFLAEALRLLRKRLESDERTEKLAATLAALADGDEAAAAEDDAVEWTDSTGHLVRYSLRGDKLWRSEDGTDDPEPALRLLYVAGNPPCVCDERGYGGEVRGGETTLAKLRALAVRAGVPNDLPLVGAPLLRTQSRQARKRRLAKAAPDAADPAPAAGLSAVQLARRLQEALALRDLRPEQPRKAAPRQQGPKLAVQHSCSAFRGTAGRRRGRATSCRACSGAPSAAAVGTRGAPLALGSCVRRGRLVSVRALPLEPGDGAASQLRALRAAAQRLAAAGKHPNIAGIVAVQRRRGAAQVFVEHAALGSAAQALRRGGALPGWKASAVARCVCSGLAHLHSTAPPLAHGGVRGAAVLLAEGGEARLMPPLPLPSANDRLARDAPWLAPEVLAEPEFPACAGHPAAPHASPAADVWAFGCLVMELLTARPPWAHLGVARSAVRAVVAAAGTGRKVLPLPPGLPHGAADLVSRCLHVDPARRPAAAELLGHHWLLPTRAQPLPMSTSDDSIHWSATGSETATVWSADEGADPQQQVGPLHGPRLRRCHIACFAPAGADGGPPRPAWVDLGGGLVGVAGSGQLQLRLTDAAGLRGATAIECAGRLVGCAATGEQARLAPPGSAGTAWRVRHSVWRTGAVSFEAALLRGHWLAARADGAVCLEPDDGSADFGERASFLLVDDSAQQGVTVASAPSAATGRDLSRERPRPPPLCPDSLARTGSGGTPLLCAPVSPEPPASAPAPPLRTTTTADSTLPAAPPPAAAHSPRAPSAGKGAPATPLKTPHHRPREQTPRHRHPEQPVLRRARTEASLPSPAGRTLGARTVSAQLVPRRGGQGAAAPAAPPPDAAGRPPFGAAAGAPAPPPQLGSRVASPQRRTRSPQAPPPAQSPTAPGDAVRRLEARLDGLQGMLERSNDAVVRRVATHVAQLLGVVGGPPGAAPATVASGVAAGCAAPPPQQQPPRPACAPRSPQAAPQPASSGWRPASDYDLYCVQPIIISR